MRIRIFWLKYNLDRKFFCFFVLSVLNILYIFPYYVRIILHFYSYSKCTTFCSLVIILDIIFVDV